MSIFSGGPIEALFGTGVAKLSGNPAWPDLGAALVARMGN
jgi:hypothetical protein